MTAAASARLACCAAADNRVTILSPTGGVLGRHCDDNHLVLDVTALAVSSSVVACGRSDGSIVVLRSDGSVQKVVAIANVKAPVCSLHFAALPFLVVAWAQAPVVRVVNANTGFDVMEINADSRGVSCVAASADGALIATARHGIKVWSSSGERVAKFSGCHVDSVVSMACAGSALLSCSRDMLVNVWPPIDAATGQSLSAKAPVMVLSCTDLPRALRTGPALLPSDEASVLAVTANGGLHVWRLRSTVQAGHVSSVAACASLPAGSDVLAADFFDAARLVVTRGPAGAPSSALLTIVSDDGDVVAAPLFAPAPSSSSSRAPASSRPSSRAPPARLDATAVATKRAKLDPRPMDQRLAELVQRAVLAVEAPSSSAASSSSSAAAAGLARTLEQALQASDADGVEAVLQTADEAVIASTVARMQPGKVPVLVEAIAARLQGKPGRAAGQMRWLARILETHAALLQSDEAARLALLKAYKVAEARVAVLEPLLRLKGKLDLVLARQARGVLDKTGKPLLELSAEDVLLNE